MWRGRLRQWGRRRGEQACARKTEMRSTSGKETHPSAARRGEKKRLHGQRKHGCDRVLYLQTNNGRGVPLLLHLTGYQLAYFNAVVGGEILQAKKAESFV